MPWFVDVGRMSTESENMIEICWLQKLDYLEDVRNPEDVNYQSEEMPEMGRLEKIARRKLRMIRPIKQFQKNVVKNYLKFL